MLDEAMIRVSAIDAQEALMALNLRVRWYEARRRAIPDSLRRARDAVWWALAADLERKISALDADPRGAR